MVPFIINPHIYTLYSEYLFPYESVFGGGRVPFAARKKARKPWSFSETAVDRIKKGLLTQETPVDSSKVREQTQWLIDADILSTIVQG